jgi:uncharacterized membrane protein YdjX (TVP38/TMEM64 family)
MKTKKQKETKHYSKKVSAIALTSFSALSCVLAVLGVIFIKTNFTDVDVFRAFVEKNYILSALSLILICTLQVIIALIPGELVEIAAGYAFGAFFGTLYALIGITLGSVIVILLSRKLGRAFVESLYPREKIDALPILNNPKKRNALVCLLFLIPGTPKDLITYVIGITDMSIPLYLMLATFARIPSILMSTIGGNALGSNRFIFAFIAFAVSGVISLVGYLIYNKITNKRHKNN